MSAYTVQQGMTIRDVVVNSTGSYSNMDSVLQANGFNDWNPDLEAGQVVQIPATALIDQNTLALLTAYPACNNALEDWRTLVDDLFAFLGDNWILATGFWNDNAVWIDTAVWNDFPPA